MIEIRHLPGHWIWAAAFFLGVALHAQAPAGQGPHHVASCIDVTGGVLSPSGQGEVVAPTQSLCEVAHQWLVWHFSGLAESLIGTARGFGETPTAGPDLALLSAQSQIEKRWQLSLDSVTKRRPDSDQRVLWLTLRSGQSENALSPLPSWRVLHRSDGTTSYFRLDDTAFDTVATELGSGWTVRVHPEAKASVRHARLRQQLDSVAILRGRFGSAGLLKPLTILISSPTDSMMSAIGIRWSRSRQLAALWYPRGLLVSPVGNDGGIDPHELAHLVHPNDRPINPLFAEAFAVSLGGSMGHTVSEELCTIALEPSEAKRMEVLTPESLISGYDHVSKLLLALALRDSFRSLNSPERMFASELWQPRTNPWQDLSVLTGRTASTLAAQSLSEAGTILKGCKPPSSR